MVTSAIIISNLVWMITLKLFVLTSKIKSFALHAIQASIPSSTEQYTLNCPNDPKRCISVDDLCDGYDDCGSGSSASDEDPYLCHVMANEDNVVCPEGQTQCPGGQCRQGCCLKHLYWILKKKVDLIEFHRYEYSFFLRFYIFKNLGGNFSSYCEYIYVFRLSI